MEKKSKPAANRKAAQRARYEALGIQRVEAKLSSRERELLGWVCYALFGLPGMNPIR